VRTTLVLDDGLLRVAKARAAKRGTTLTSLLEDALRAYLAPPRRSARPFRLKLVTKRGRLLPGVDLADRDSLYERMEGRT
jgi:hypothetical protein